MLEGYIRDTLEKKGILLMTHIVIGYPDLETSTDLVQAMVDSGVDLMELQIPFSEPIADGPVIESANQRALSAGITVARCLEFARTAAAVHPIPFLFMSYYNILFKYGVERFAAAMKEAGLAGAIVPDLPHEAGTEYLAAMRSRGLAAVMLFAPSTPEARMREIAARGSGFVYCVARKGVTGLDTAFGAEIAAYLARARGATGLPLAVGFGIRERKDVEFLKGKAEIAVIGSEMIRVANERGAAGVAASLRAMSGRRDAGRGKAQRMMIIENAERKDLPSILALQKLCYRETAERYHDYSIPPLTQTLDELQDDLERCVMLKMADGPRIIGSVRAYERDGTVYIGRVIVHPDFQNRGLGKSLMLEIERRFPNALRFELFTGHRDEKNKRFYGRLGYRIFREEPERRLVFLEKAKP